MIVSLDNPRKEIFSFPNGMKLLIDYCIKDNRFKELIFQVLQGGMLLPVDLGYMEIMKKS